MLVAVEAAIAIGVQVASGRLVGAVATAIGRRDERVVTAALVVLGVLYALNNVVPAVRTLLSTWLGSRVDHTIRLRLMERMLGPVGVAHLEDATIRDEVARAGGIGFFTPGGVVDGMANIVQERLVSLGFLFIVVTWKWWIGAILMISALMSEAANRRQYMQMARIVYRQTQDLRRSDYYRSLVMGTAAKELRVFGLAEWMEERFAHHWLDAMRSVWKERDLQDSFIRWAVPLQVATQGGAYVLIGLAAVHRHLSLGRATVLVMAVGGIRAFISYGLHRTGVEYGATAFLPILDLDEQIAAHGSPGSGSVDPAGLPVSEIRFEDVSFRYPGRDTDVFSHLDLVIPAGRSLAIVGLNGAGKTTLCKLLARCYEPTGGRILVDGIPITDLDARAWQRRIAAVFQDFVVFPLPLRDNIGFGAVDRRDDHALEVVAERAACLDILERVPFGWDTVLAKHFDKGTEVSGGEAQRIALARALLALDAGASVLLLDEPTAALDVRAEAQLFDCYLELTRGVTSVLVSHRFSTVRHADLISVLEDGRVVESGTHGELVDAGGKYAEMFNLQASRFTEEAVAGD